MEKLILVNELFINWFINHGFKILGISIGTYILFKFGRTFIEKGIRRAIKPGKNLTPAAEKMREDTLIRVFVTTFHISLIAMASLMIISEIGLNIGPLLAGAGIAGVAIGFGGQYLIKDIISGFFIIFENQYRVGDVVCIDGKCGAVEDINLRLTVLRDMDGTVHHIPNGEIRIASNLSKNKANVNLNIGVSYDSSLDHVIKVVNRVGEELAKDKKWKDDIITSPQFLRVNNFADSSIIIKITGETAPLRQWAITGELRKRLKEEFDREKIEIPFPQRVIHQPK
jgi:moderate conductance mechanosensitive channel